jgi:Heavy-metal-associated domain.
MKKLVFGAAFLLAASSAFAAETVKATVGHMCCGGCKATATKGVQSVAWVDSVAIDDGGVVTVTAKADQKADLIALTDALNKSGFPARDIQVSGPVTLSVAHLCCGGCANDLKTKLAAVRSEILDKDKIVVDQSAKTVTLQPVAGKSMNIVPILRQMANAGFAASKCSMAAAATTSTK